MGKIRWEILSTARIAHQFAEDPHRTSTYHIESQLIEHFKRIYYFSKRIAKLVVETDVVDGRALPVEAVT
jgi:hypothetical protein